MMGEDLALVAVPIAQVVLYYLLAFGVFRVSALRALAIVALRLAIGVPLFWLILLINLENAPAVPLLISAPFAWLMAALLDPKRTRDRLLGWVVGGTALSFVINGVGAKLLGFDLWHHFVLN